MDSINNSESKQPFKRKKQRSFITKVKKRFKSGNFCRGVRVDSVEHDYFVRIFELDRNFSGTTDDKKVFANNALAQTEGKEVHYASNQLISRVIENLLPVASDSALERFFEAFASDLRPICVHEFASHVLQTVMVVAAQHSQEISGDDDSKHQTKCQIWLDKVSRFLLNNIEEFMLDSFANPCLRTAMFCLAGVPHLDKHFKKDEETSEDTKLTSSKVSDEFLELLAEFYTRIAKWPQFKSKDFLENHLSSNYVQALLQVLKSSGQKHLYKQLFTQILNDCFPSEASEMSPSVLAVLEVMIGHSKPKPLRTLYKKVLQPRLIVMSSAQVGNIAIQKFINACSDTELFSEVLKQLTSQFSAVNKNVLVSLAQGCRRLQSGQSDFVQALTKMLNCDNTGDQKQLVAAVLSLQPLPHDKPAVPTRPGSQLLQALLHFQKPIKFVNSLLAHEPAEVANILSSIYGSFITKDFLQAELISEKNKQKLIKKLVGHYVELAQTKFGSRSFDDLWKAADEKNRVAIVKDLAPSYSQLVASHNGQFVATKVHLLDFKNLGVEEWTKRVNRQQSALKLFSPLIGNVK